MHHYARVVEYTPQVLENVAGVVEYTLQLLQHSLFGPSKCWWTNYNYLFFEFAGNRKRMRLFIDLDVVLFDTKE